MRSLQPFRPRHTGVQLCVICGSLPCPLVLHLSRSLGTTPLLFKSLQVQGRHCVSQLASAELLGKLSRLGYLRTSGMFIVMLGLRIIPWLTHLPRSHVEGLWMGGFGTLHSPSALLTPRPCLGSGLSRKPPFMRAGRCLLCAREPLIGSLQPGSRTGLRGGDSCAC